MKASNVFLRAALRHRTTTALRRSALKTHLPETYLATPPRILFSPQRALSTTVTNNTLKENSVSTIDLDAFVVRIQDCLQEGDTQRSHEAYQELKSALRTLQQHNKTNSNHVLEKMDNTKWRSILEDLFRALIAKTKDDVESLDSATMMETTSQAHEILEDLDERFGLHAMSVPPKEEDNAEELVKDGLDNVQPLESTVVFSFALDVLQAWARSSHKVRLDKLVLLENNMATTSSSSPKAQRLGRGVPQRAQFLLQQLERLSSNNNLPVEYYEAVLETWACSSEHLRGVQAEKVLQRIPPFSLTPAAFHWIIRAWTWSRDPRAAFTATGHLMKRLRYHSNKDDDYLKQDGMEPVLEDYEIIFDAWARAEDKMAPTKALSLWTLWQTSIEDGITDVKPSLAVYRSLLQTATKRPNQPDLGRRLVDVLLARMKDELIIPDTACYEAAICVWKNCALHPEVPEDRQFCLRRTTTLLADLRNAHRRRSADGTASGATTLALNHVMECLQISDHSQRAILAEGILKEMEENLMQGNQDAAPNPDSYRFVLDVYRTIESRDRIPQAKTLLWRCKDNLLKGNDTAAAIRKETVEVLNAFVLVCATTPKPVAREEGVLILREALYAVERFRADCNVRPNDTTYNNLLFAARGLLGNDQHRTKIVDQVFRLACQDGMVNDVLLQSLMEVTTPEQYQMLVVGSSETVEGFKVIPKSWSRNILGGRVVSSDGRRVKPVGIDGRLTETKAMKEFKMRRLRDKRNKKLLQGGRWDRSQDM